MNRRTFIQAAPSLAALASLPSLASAASATTRQAPAVRTGPLRDDHVVVVGAGAFGGWTALHLLRSGAQVTLLDAWGAGNSRASSGGETRVTRHAYGNRVYVDLVARALDLWEENREQFGAPIFHRTGVLFMAPGMEGFVGPAGHAMTEAGIAHEILTHDEIARRWPLINPQGMTCATWEEQAGFLLARRGCQAVVDAFIAEGGDYRVANVEPGPIRSGQLEGIRLSDGTTLQADRYVFACGPWLGRVFPDVIGNRVEPTRQEVFFFGPPAGDIGFDDLHFPVWADMSEQVWYGIPGNERRGFKIALDNRGHAFDPTDGDRVPTPAKWEAARDYVAFRFPRLAGAPLVDARVCQYEQSPDGHYIIDRHPEAANVWISGGGSGHGYKVGASVGEMTAQLVLGERQVEPLFSLSRFS